MIDYSITVDVNRTDICQWGVFRAGEFDSCDAPVSSWRLYEFDGTVELLTVCRRHGNAASRHVADVFGLTEQVQR